MKVRIDPADPEQFRELFQENSYQLQMNSMFYDPESEECTVKLTCVLPVDDPDHIQIVGEAEVADDTQTYHVQVIEDPTEPQLWFISFVVPNSVEIPFFEVYLQDREWFLGQPNSKETKRRAKTAGIKAFKDLGTLAAS